MSIFKRKNLPKEKEVVNSSLEELNRGMKEATNTGSLADLGKAMAMLEATKAERKKEIIKTIGLIGAAALTAAGTIVAAIIKSSGHMKGIDRVAKYEKEEDLIFTGKTFNEIERP